MSVRRKNHLNLHAMTEMHNDKKAASEGAADYINRTFADNCIFLYNGYRKRKRRVSYENQRRKKILDGHERKRR